MIGRKGMRKINMRRMVDVKTNRFDVSRLRLGL